ncbi:MAG: [protein-PII] uridylyltransferase [Burkholderiales bacterium]|nr:[protein-PII] uridylyltransferase [Burkholderiales bacterium]
MTETPALDDDVVATGAEGEVGLLRRRLKQGREQLRAAYSRRAAPRPMLIAHRRLVDRVLKQAWRGLSHPAGSALVAVGGFGRGTLFPCSDIDLLILVDSDQSSAHDPRIGRLIGTLWDIGLEVGHSVRTPQQCVELSAQDITVQTSLLEARWLCGDRQLFRRFGLEFQAALDPQMFCKAKQLEQRQRHERFVDTNLEPNLKEFPGGLRDLHHLLWIARAAKLGNSWRALIASGLVISAEARQLEHLERCLSDIRIRLHYLAGRREDRLLFDYQTQLARELGLEDRTVRRASEQLMQTIYRTANAVRQLNTIVHQNVAARIFPQRTEAPRVLNERFRVRNELLESATEELFEREPTAILECFALLQEHHELKGMRASTLRALWRARRRIDAAFRSNALNRARFMAILRNPRLIRELRRMNEYGILGRYIPAFGRVVGQMQHDLYHVYTVDEHIFKVVRNLRRFTVPELAHEYPLCSRLISDLERPEVLYLAGLFHDIAKGRGGDHSVLGEADARRFCRAHGLCAEDIELVAWLVRHHLRMSATAQKQDIDDPATVRAFACLVGDDRHLVSLYLLTVADIRGTSPKVWNGWKAKLLEDLFWATRRVLAGEHVSRQSSVEMRQAEALSRLRLDTIPDDAHEKLWAQLDTSYFLRHEAQEIAWHTRLLNYRVESAVPIVKARLAPNGEGLQVLIYTPDQEELFARICHFFSRAGFSIAEAKIHTTRHGYALDSFIILDPNERDATSYRDVMSYVEHELAQRLERRAPLDPPASGRLSRRVRHFPISPEIELQPDERGTYTVLSVISSDRPGLLYRIALVLVRYDLNLHSAKINTLGERVEDTFLITGAALKDARTSVRLESELLQALQIE